MGPPGTESVNQFALPRGIMGRLAGWVMAVGNADMERRAIRGLALQASSSVLEVGFGPGVGVTLLARRLPNGFVAGVDPSEVMLAQASRRNRAAIRDGRIDLRLGTAESLPWGDGRFDGVVSVNNIQEWPSLSAALAEIRRVLREGGDLSIAVHSWVTGHARDRGAAERPWSDHLVAALEAAGFVAVKSQVGRAVSGRAHYLAGTRE